MRDFFFDAAGTDPQQLVQVVGHVPISLAFVKDLEIGFDQGHSAAEEKGDLSSLHLLAGELGAARESGQIVGDRFGRVVHDLADLRSGLALECQPDDLSAMREDWSKVVECAAHGDQHAGVSLADQYKVTGDGSRSDEEDAIGEVFGREQGPLAEGLLAKVEDPRLTKAGGAVLLKQKVVDLAAMQSQADGLLLAVGDGLSGRLIRSDGDEGDLPRGRLGALGGEEGEVDLFDDVKNGFGLEGGTVKSLLNFGGEASIEGFGIQPLDDLAVSIANAHRLNLLNKCRPSVSGQTYVWKVRAKQHGKARVEPLIR
jgi:hypothetical protein